MDTQPNIESTKNFQSIFSRIGHLTRLLRDSLTDLGLDRAIMDAAEAIPDARDRLNYIVDKTSQAADRALNCVEIARPLQDELNSKALALTSRWDDWFEEPVEMPVAKELVKDTRSFLTLAPVIATQTNEQLMEIMMAQDFQDLTGQVIKRMMIVVQEIENQLLMVLMENIPEQQVKAKRENDSLLNGPQLDANGVGVVASQEQVDDLLDSLGF